MNPEVAVKIFEAGKSAGADFVEIFEEETRSSSLGLKDRQIETATAGTEYGIGVRLLYGTEVLYGFTSDDSEEALVKLVKTLAFGRIAAAAGGTGSATNRLNLLPKSASVILMRLPIRIRVCLARR